MRPQAIILFERLMLASFVVGLTNIATGFSRIQAIITQSPLNPLAMTVGMIVGLGFGLLLPLGLALLISRRASNVAKWILVVLLVLGLLRSPTTLANPMMSPLGKLGYLVISLIQIGAAIMLFRKDVREWLGRRGATTDPDVFS